MSVLSDANPVACSASQDHIQAITHPHATEIGVKYSLFYTHILNQKFQMRTIYENTLGYTIITIFYSM
jgi:hypothetical protein